MIYTSGWTQSFPACSAVTSSSPSRANFCKPGCRSCGAAVWLWQPRGKRPVGVRNSDTSFSTSETSSSRRRSYTRCWAGDKSRSERRALSVLGQADHGVIHSLYSEDPDGNEVELYIDGQLPVLERASGGPARGYKAAAAIRSPAGAMPASCVLKMQLAR